MNGPMFQQPKLHPENEIDGFKTTVKRWLAIDEEIAEHERKIKELKALKNKKLEPQITGFMRQYNIRSLNTDKGKIDAMNEEPKSP